MKKGMSPLLSTVILLGFAIALGGVVISWGNASTKTTPQACEQASLEIVDLAGKPLICDDGSRLQFTLSNNGEVVLDGLKLSFLFDEGSETKLVKNTIAVADVVKLSTDYSNRKGSIQKVFFTPSFIDGNKAKLCPKRGFSIENIEAC